MSEWLNAEEAAKYLGFGASSLYSLAQQGKIPGHKVGKVWRFDKAELDSWIRANKPLDEFFISIAASIDDNDLLRDPQKEGYSAASDFISSGGKKAILQLPVGCGKTGLISLLPFGLARGRVLVIAPNLTIRDELKRNLDVSNRRFCFWVKCGILSAEDMTAGPYVAVLDGKDANIHDCNKSHIVLTNIQQLASSADRWLPAFPDDYFDMVIVDEGHHSAAPSWMKVFEKFPNAKVINLTATPFRADRKDIEGDLIYRYSFKRAMMKGYIKKLQAVYVAPEEMYFTYKGNKRHHTLAEVLELKEEEWFSKGIALAPECNKHIVESSLDRLETLRQTGTHHQLIAVACSVAHAESIRALYSERGYEAAEIHSGMPDEKRAEVLQKLRAGLLDCIIQVQMLGEGFDHPHLSVAAIFRPFRSLSPFVQFVGRIMRVVVQNDPRHPDNYGFVVTHIGLNLDQQLADFRDMEKDDLSFFEDLFSGKEPEVPREVLEGKTRLKLRPDLIVHSEIVSDLFEEDFLQTDDDELLTELKARAEALGFDSEQIINVLNTAKKEKLRRTPAAAPFPIQPQRQRQESRKRLQEEVSHTAHILLNRLNLKHGGNELTFKFAPGAVTGTNFVAAVQMVNHEIDKHLGIKSGQRGTLRTEDFSKGIDQLSEVLDTLTRRIKRRMTDYEEGEDTITD